MLHTCAVAIPSSGDGPSGLHSAAFRARSRASSWGVPRCDPPDAPIAACADTLRR